jgi:Protein of unknown function (DUF2752)
MDQRPQISPRGRLLLAAIGLAVGGALATARTLTPDARGYGTHEQLGWAPCWFRTWTGRPCPTCGMTTAWAYATSGRLTEALAANAAGTAACGLAVLAAPWLLAAAVAGRWLAVRPTPRLVLWVGTTILTLTLLDWARRLVAN